MSLEKDLGHPRYFIPNRQSSEYVKKPVKYRYFETFLEGCPMCYISYPCRVCTDHFPNATSGMTPAGSIKYNTWKDLDFKRATPESRVVTVYGAYKCTDCFDKFPCDKCANTLTGCARCGQSRVCADGCYTVRKKYTFVDTKPT
jgi:hypothetical protein